MLVLYFRKQLTKHRPKEKQRMIAFHFFIPIVTARSSFMDEYFYRSDDTF
jgi:hypothetical protein